MYAWTQPSPSYPLQVCVASMHLTCSAFHRFGLSCRRGVRPLLHIMELHGSRLVVLEAKGEAINVLIGRWNKHEPLCSYEGMKKKQNFIQGLWIFLSDRVKGTWLFFSSYLLTRVTSSFISISKTWQLTPKQSRWIKGHYRMESCFVKPNHREAKIVITQDKESDE